MYAQSIFLSPFLRALGIKEIGAGDRRLEG
jgi:hypothetical protein